MIQLVNYHLKKKITKLENTYKFNLLYLVIGIPWQNKCWHKYYSVTGRNRCFYYIVFQVPSPRPSAFVRLQLIKLQSIQLSKLLKLVTHNTWHNQSPVWKTHHYYCLGIDQALKTPDVKPMAPKITYYFSSCWLLNVVCRYWEGCSYYHYMYYYSQKGRKFWGYRIVL